MNKEVNAIILNQIKLFDKLSEQLYAQRDAIKNNKIFDLDSISNKINEICKKIVEEEVSLRKVLDKKTIKDFVMENKDDKELYDSYILLTSLVERLTLVKEDNLFLIRKSLAFTNKLLSSINKNTENPNVYTRKPNY